MITGKKNLPNNHYIYFDSFQDMLNCGLGK